MEKPFRKGPLFPEFVGFQTGVDPFIHSFIRVNTHVLWLFDAKKSKQIDADVELSFSNYRVLHVERF